jgi:hypothetical protein
MVRHLHALLREVRPQDRFNGYYRKKLALFSHLFEKTWLVFRADTNSAPFMAGGTNIAVLIELVSLDTYHRWYGYAEECNIAHSR